MNEKKFKQTLLNRLYAPYVDCTMCPLGSQGRTHVVFGSGNPNATLMFIGEGPGRDEDLRGKPFVGRSGKLLDVIFDRIGITRDAIFITNIVKCRPPNNRKPTQDESKICKSILLDHQLKIVRPKVICTLGATALSSLFNKEVKISLLRGTALIYNTTFTVIPTYHPAYILRNNSQLKTLVSDIARAVELSTTK